MLPEAVCDSRWFHALCEVAIVGAICSLYWLRTRQIALLYIALSAGRLARRERIAAELHDTLLQDTQGLVLVFQGLSGQLEKHHPLRVKMEAALDEAEQSLKLARERAWDQLSIGAETDIGNGVRRTSEELLAGSELAVSLLIIGRPRPVQRGAAVDICRFARQALVDALTHANAREIEVEIEYGSESLSIRVRDDGSGVISAPENIRESARRIGARLCVWSGDNAGTEMELMMNGDSAYR
jgi:signal transduction histidine kinase